MPVIQTNQNDWWDRKVEQNIMSKFLLILDWPIVEILPFTWKPPSGGNDDCRIFFGSSALEFWLLILSEWITIEWESFFGIMVGFSVSTFGYNGVSTSWNTEIRIKSSHKKKRDSSIKIDLNIFEDIILPPPSFYSLKFGPKKFWRLSLNHKRWLYPH